MQPYRRGFGKRSLDLIYRKESLRRLVQEKAVIWQAQKTEESKRGLSPRCCYDKLVCHGSWERRKRNGLEKNKEKWFSSADMQINSS